MFGKNYDKEIGELTNLLKTTTDNINTVMKEMDDMMDFIKGLQKDMIDIASVQATHKASISFLLNHATVDEDAKEDLMKMLDKISEINEMVERVKK